MNYKIAICDDSGADRQYVLNMVRAWASSAGHTVHIDDFPSAESFLFRYAEESDYDMLLLDIEMGAMDGVRLAKRVRRDNEAVQIVFVTGYSDYIAEGYEVAALHYLMKPVSRDKLFGVLNRALERRQREERCLNLELGGEMVRIPFYDVRYLDVRQNYVTVHGKTEYTVKRSLNEFEKELDDRFFRAGRSLIINLKYIRRVTKTEVSLSDGTLLPLPRGAYEPLNRAIIKHT